MLRIRLRDDRDRTARLLPAAAPLAVRDWAAGLPRLRARALPRTALALLRHGPVLAFVGATMTVVVLVTVWWHDHAVGFGLILFTPVAVPLITAGLVGLRGLLGLGGWLPVAMRASMLARRRCPACGYDLRGLAAEPDGCLVCPECRGAWDERYVGDAARSGPEVVVLDDW